jgi:hypothetical protein
MRKRISAIIIGIVVILFLVFSFPVKAQLLLQLPTVAIPTVTGTPQGQVITVHLDQEQINVRGGPGTAYPKVGVLLPGQQAPAKGRSQGGLWILIDYPGAAGGMAWVYSALVDVSPGELPVVEPPPTPTPLYTPTIDPTLAAQFVITTVPTHLPTFTAPPPLALPTFQVAETGPVAKVPIGLVIIVIASLGIFLGLLSLIRR